LIACSVETWPSGRRHFPAKEAYGLKPVSRVRIPPSPPRNTNARASGHFYFYFQILFAQQTKLRRRVSHLRGLRGGFEGNRLQAIQRPAARRRIPPSPPRNTNARASGHFYFYFQILFAQQTKLRRRVSHLRGLREGFEENRTISALDALDILAALRKVKEYPPPRDHQTA